MNRLSQFMTRLAALAVPLRAEELTPDFSFALPAGHLYALGLGTDGSDLFLFSLDSYYTTPFDVGGSMVFTKSTTDFAGLNVRLTSQSQALNAPTDANTVLLTGGLGANTLLYDLRLSPPSQTNISLGFTSVKPTGLTMDASGAVYLSSGVAGQGIFKLADAGTNTPVWNSGTTGPGALNAPGALSFGPDGLLYVLDTDDNRIVSFDTDGTYQSAFALVDPAQGSALAIDDQGHLYTMNSSGGGDIYDIYTGTQVGTLADTGDVGIGPGKASLLYADGYLFAMTGDGANVYAYTVPEPSAAALLVGVGTLVLVFLRRWPGHRRLRSS